MDIADMIAPMLTTTQWVMLIFFGAALAVAILEREATSRFKAAIKALRASRNAAKVIPTSQPRLRVSRQAEWKLADPLPSLQRYKEKKAQGLL
jgi:hypothetical protein